MLPIREKFWFVSLCFYIVNGINDSYNYNGMELIDVLYTLHEREYRVNFVGNTKRSSIIIGNIIAKCLAFVIRILIPIVKVPKEPLQQGNNIIVSIASYPKRFPFLRYTLVSVLRQTNRPEKIIINLTKEECPHLRLDLPDYLTRLEKYGVEFVFLEENLRPHTKYIYVLQYYWDKCIITLDDDVFYCKDTLEKLVYLHENNPGCVCANLVRRIMMDEDGHFMPYSTWPLNNINVKGHEYLALGVGGVLYPANLFKNSSVFNKEKIRSLSLNADDLWLKAHEILLDIPVVSGDLAVSNIDVSMDIKKVGTLSVSNVNGGNDMQWEALEQEYKLKERMHENHDSE